MPPRRMTIMRLIAWINDLAVKNWPDHPTVRHLSALFSKVAGRVLAGVVTGLVLGSLSAMVGIRLSGVNISDAATFNRMVKLVISFAVVWAVILACIFNFTYLYLRFLQYQETRWARK